MSDRGLAISGGPVQAARLASLPRTLSRPPESAQIQEAGLKQVWGDDIDRAKSPSANRSSLAIQYYREEDGGWLADIPALPGVTTYGRSKKQATAAVQALALRLIADRLEHGEAIPGPMDVSFIAA